MERARILIATFWAGSLWTTGYLVAPILFGTVFDGKIAGMIAANIFHVEAWVCIGCGVALAASLKLQPTHFNAVDGRFLMRVILAMLACTVIGYFALQPFMAALREAAHAAEGGVMDAVSRRQFGLLHGAAMVFYLIESILAGVLVLKVR